MEVPKLIILLCCTYYSFASHHHSHTIPVEGYETELQDLGEHVDHHDTPVKVIKITKTIAVKIPVPYPVKVVEKVPYPVHISKPYPVPVPHIVKVPQPVQKHAHEAVDTGLQDYQGGAGDGHYDQSYQVQEAPSHDFGDSGSYGGGTQGHNVESFVQKYTSHKESPVSSYDAPSHTYYGSSGIPDGKSFESNSYDEAIQSYLQKNNPSSAHSYNSFH